jgi:PAS domain S-box-containing protein
MNRRNESDLEQALARAADGAFAITPDGKIVLWNTAAEKILGYTARDSIGRHCYDVCAGFDDSGNRLCYRGCHVMSLIKMGDPVQHFDMQTRTKADRPLWVNVSTLTVPCKDATDGLIIHLFRDVTAAKELLTLVRDRRWGPDLQAGGNGSLTRRELEILRLIGTGVTTRSVAERLHVSTSTVRNHIQSILEKLSVHSRLEAVAYATRHRLL